MERIKFVTGSIRSSLAGTWRLLRRFLHWLVHRNWLKVLQMAKLVVEIIKDARNLLFCVQSRAGDAHPGGE